MNSSEELLQATLNTNQMVKEENNILKNTIQLLLKEKERLEEEIEPSKDEDIENYVANDIPEHKCLECDFITHNQTLLKGHQVKHNIHKCNKCSKQFNSKTSLNQHILDKHSTSNPVGHHVWTSQKNAQPENIKCSDCTQVFDSRPKLENHFKQNHSDYSCIQCGEMFTTKQDINNHKQEVHNNQFYGLAFENNQSIPRIKCQQCNYETNSKNKIEYHIETVHQLYVQRHRGVCKFYRQGRCTRQPCPYRHPQSQAANSMKQQNTPACSRGTNCRFLASNSCHFFHPGVGVQLERTAVNRQTRGQGQLYHQPARGQEEQEEVNSSQTRCHFQLRCWNQATCSFIHEDFRMQRDFQENF